MHPNLKMRETLASTGSVTVASTVLMATAAMANALTKEVSIVKDASKREKRRGVRRKEEKREASGHGDRADHILIVANRLGPPGQLMLELVGGKSCLVVSSRACR